MATKNVWAACVAALLGLVNFVLTSCGSSEDINLTPAAPEKVPYEVVKYVDRDKLVYVNKDWNTIFDGERITINGETALFADVNHKNPIIEMAAANHAAATITDADELRWYDSNGQETTGTLTKYESKDGSYTIYAALVPASEYSIVIRLHEKVSQVTTYHILSGSIVYHTANGDENTSFEFKLKRSYLLVDPTVNTQIITQTDTLIQVQIETKIDTVYVDKPVVVNHTDTINVYIDKFIKGSDVNQAVVNDLGYSVGTLSLGGKLLLKVTLNHRDPILNVVKDKLGNVSFTPSFELQWIGDDDQLTTGGKEVNNVTIKSFSFVRCEFTKITDTMYIVRTVYSVTGSFYNENNDICQFTMELTPSYIQKYEEAAPKPNNEEKTLYRGIIRSLSVDGLKLMTKPIRQKWNAETNAWEDDYTFKRVCVGLSGSPSGLDLFVKSRKVIEENEDSHWYTATGNPEMDKQWIGEDSKTDGTVVYRNTKIYNFNFMFTADAVNNGLVGPQTELYVMRAEKVTVLDPDGNALVCTWEDGSEFSLSTSVKLNDTKYVDDPALVGKTRTESDKLYKYDTTFTQNFTASIGGKELQNVTAKSPLWIPAE